MEIFVSIYWIIFYGICFSVAQTEKKKAKEEGEKRIKELEQQITATATQRKQSKPSKEDTAALKKLQKKVKYSTTFVEEFYEFLVSNCESSQDSRSVSFAIERLQKGIKCSKNLHRRTFHLQNIHSEMFSFIIIKARTVAPNTVETRI